MSNYYKNKYPIYLYIGMYNFTKKVILYLWRKIK
jgi:hypothetical protein